jgi:acyl-[acyl-carrier-protein]-phospholipid O-acyltransferase/long-chain-fatty-acid--[acyl-carrier-protein] ligase
MYLLHENFIKIAKELSSKTAIKDKATGKDITYGKALIATLILSKKFKNYKDNFLGIMLPTSSGCILTILSALMAGKIPVMINYSTGASNNIKFAQKKCNFKTVITSKALLQKIECPFVEGMVFIEDIVNSISVSERIMAALTSKMPLTLLLSKIYKWNLDDTAVILFTSGSENDPKAVQLSHKNICSNIESFIQVFSLSEKDIMLANLPLFHVFGLTVNMWTPLHFGMTIITYSNPLEYKTIVNIIKNDKPTIMVGTPSFLSGYLRASTEGDFKSLKFVISGADKCPDSLREGYLKKHKITIYEGYGTTETSPVISVNTPAFNKPGSIGKPIPNVDVKIENYITGEICKPNEIGKIVVKGNLVMKGYFDDFEQTSLKIRGGWYDTGDMGYIDEDGFLWYAGRSMRFVKIGGEMISLVKVENTLEKYLPKDVECCIVEIPDAIKGAKIIAVVTKPVDEQKIIKQMSNELPNIALPKKFIVINELPKMGSGKIDLRKTTELVKEILSK